MWRFKVENLIYFHQVLAFNVVKNFKPETVFWIYEEETFP
jgi:hypothetical protein